MTDSQFTIFLAMLVGFGIVLIATAVAIVRNEILFQRSVESLKDGMILLARENQKGIEQSRREVLQIVKPLSAITARIHEVVETTHPPDESED